MDDEGSTIYDDAKQRFHRALDDNLEKRRRLIRARSEKREADRRAPVKVVITVGAETRDKAERACALTRGMSLVQWLHLVTKTLSEMPEGYIPRKERERRGHVFARYSDRMIQKRIADILGESGDEYSAGITMQQVLGLLGVLDDGSPLIGESRPTLTVVGKIMRNLGYRKHRTYIPKTDDAPAKLGWIYRKEESWEQPAS